MGPWIGHAINQAGPSDDRETRASLVQAAWPNIGPISSSLRDLSFNIGY